MEAIRRQLYEAENSRDLLRGEVTILRSNMSKSSQVHMSQLRDVRQTQNVEKLEHEQELERLKLEVETLRTQRAFFENDLFNLRNANKNLEKKLNQVQEGGAIIPSQVQVREKTPEVSRPISNSPKEVSPKKRPRPNIQESFMDGFSVAFPSPSKRSRQNKHTLSPSPKRSLKQNRFIPIGSSSDRSPNPAPLSSPQGPVEELINQNNENVMEELRADAVQAWSKADNNQEILDFIDSVLSHNVVGTAQPSMDYLNGFSVKFDQMEFEQPISSLLKASVLYQVDSAYSGLVVINFTQTCVEILEACTTETNRGRCPLIKAVPVLLLLLYQAIKFSPQIIVSNSMAIPVLHTFVSEKIGFFVSSDTPNIDDQSLSVEAVYYRFSLLYALDLLECLSCGTANTSCKSSVWEVITHSTLDRLLTPSTSINILIKTVTLLITSITDQSIGSLCIPLDLVDAEDIRRHQAQQRSDLLVALAHLLVEITTPTLSNVFSSINNPVAFQYVSYSWFQSLTTDKSSWNSSFNLNTWYTSDEATNALLENFHQSMTIFLRRCIIKLFVLVLFKQDPRVLTQHEPVLAAIIHCLSFELDTVYNSISAHTGDQSSQESIALISDCVKLLHAMWTLQPSTLTSIARLPGSTPHEHVVSLARIHFSDPPSTLSGMDYNQDESGESSNDDDPDTTYEDPKFYGVFFDSDVTNKARDLLENSVTLEEAEDLFASMSI